MPLTNRRSPEQWAALVEEVRARSARRATDKRSKVAKQAWKRLADAKRAARRKGRRDVLDKIEAVRAMEKLIRDTAANAEVERIWHRISQRQKSEWPLRATSELSPQHQPNIRVLHR
jgi:hypothetical protein